MSEKKIGARITLSGEKEFKSAVTSCNKALSAMKSEMNLVKAETAAQGNSLEILKRKQEVLNKTLESSQQKEAAVANGLENARKNYEAVGKKLDEYKQSLKDAEKALEEMQSSGSATAEEVKDQEQAITQLKTAIEKGEQTYKRAGDRVQDWQKQLADARTETVKIKSALSDTETAMDDLANGVVDCSDSVDDLGDHIDDAADKLTSFGTVLKTKVYDTLIDLGTTAIKDAVSASLELDEATQKLAASTGASASEMEDYSDALMSLYQNNYGDSISDLADKFSYIKQVTGEIDTSSLETLTEDAITLEDTFGSDYQETIRGVSNLMSHFGITAEDAFDLFAKGSQLGLDYTHELGDNIAEYSGNFEQAGYTAEEYFQLLVNGSQNGSYNLDKVNDSINEIKNRLADGTINDSLSLFSTDTQAAFKAWQDGKGTMKGVIDSIVNDISTCTNEQEALNMAAIAFGTMGEDANLQVVKSLTSTGDAFKDVKGIMESLKDVRYDSISNQYKQLGRQFQASVSEPILKKFLPAAQKGLNVLEDNLDTLVPVVTGLGTAFATMWVVKKASDMITTIKDATTAVLGLTTQTTAQTVAQEGLNAAMSANPIGIVVAAVSGLATGISTFVALCPAAETELDTLQAAAQGALDSLKDSQDALEESMGTAADSVADAQASGAIADEVADKLINLANKTTLTKDEQAEMAGYVEQLNQLYPDWGLAIDEATGKLNKSNTEIRSQIDNMKELSIAQAYQEAYQDVIEGVTEAQKDLIEATAEKTKVDEKLKDLDEDYNEVLKLSAEATKEHGDGVIEWNGVMRQSEDVLAEIVQQQSDLKGTQEDLTDSIEENQVAVEAAQEKATDYYNAYNDLTDAEKENTDATNANTDAQNAASDAHQYSINTAGEAAAAFNSLSQSEQESAVAVANSITELTNSVQSSLDSQMNMFEQFSAGTETTKDQILANMQSQVDGVTAWEENMNALMNETKTASDGTQVAISEGLMQYLAEMGPEGASYVQSFVSMSGDELAKANELWEQSVDIKSMTNDLGQQLQEGIGSLSAGGEEAFASLAESLGVQASDTGGNIAQGLVDGLNAAKSEIQTAGTSAGTSVIDALDEGAGCQSPSHKTKITGRHIVRGLQIGIENNQNLAVNQGSTLASATVAAINNIATSSATYSHGYYLATGLAAGIRNNQSIAINAAVEMATNTINAAKNKLEINSPSHVFQRLGSGVIEGFVKGIDDHAIDATDTIKSAMDFSDVSVRGGWDASSLSGSISSAITASGANADVLSKLDALYTILSTYLPDAGNVYLDGAVVSKKVSEYQNKSSMIRQKIAGVM